MGSTSVKCPECSLSLYIKYIYIYLSNAKKKRLGLCFKDLIIIITITTIIIIMKIIIIIISA